MNRIIENNQVTISGEIASGFNFSHETYGEKFYIVNLKIQRTSGTDDIIPVTVSDRLVDVSEDYTGLFVSVTGQFRSFSKKDGDRRKLLLSVFAREFVFAGDNEQFRYHNEIFIDGFICKDPVFRETPYGREITDLLIAVNRPYGKSDYIPCICWGRNARYAGNLKVGERCSVTGRIQSRIYIKTLDDGSTEERTAYEVSVNKMEVVEDAD